MAFRVDYGGDYKSYEDYYNYIHAANKFIPDNSEIGFTWLVYMMPSYRLLLIAISLLFSSALFFLFKRYIPSNYWAISFIILFISKSMLIGNMSGTRNSIAVVAFIYGFYFLETRRKLPYILLMIGVSFFHTSSLFFLPLIFITPNRLSAKGIRWLITAIVTFLFITILTPNILKSGTIWIVNISYFTRYETYLEEDTIAGFRGISYLIILFILYVNIVRLKQTNNKRESLIIKISLLYLMLMLTPSIGLFSRFYFYLSFPFLVGAIYIFEKEKNMMIRYAYIVSILLMFGMEFYGFAKSDRFLQLYANYHSILLK